jgi:UDP-N-acetylglucosamine 1-carboxyvinyltransferase
MDKLLIAGGVPLSGEVAISGAKNAALPLLCAALLTKEPVTFTNVPHLNDIGTMLKLLAQMGVKVTRERAESQGRRWPVTVILDASGLDNPWRPTRWSRPCAPRSWCSARWWRAAARRACRCPAAAPSARGRSISTSRACRRWAPRLRSSRAMCTPRPRLKGARLFTDMVTVTGTENLMMAACLAEGETVIENAAREPEVVDLANCLVAMGARISGAGGDVIRIQGVEALHGATHRIMPDRIETGTYLCAAAATGGEVRLTGTSSSLPRCGDRQADGCRLRGDAERDAIRLKAPRGSPR